MLATRGRFVLFCGLLLGGVGCQGTHRPTSGTRVWADWNTLCAPAFYVERFDHHPPQRKRVDYYRWMYGGAPAHVIPASSVVVGEGEFVAPPAATGPRDALPQELPPPAPPATSPSDGSGAVPRQRGPIGPSARGHRTAR